MEGCGPVAQAILSPPTPQCFDFNKISPWAIVKFLLDQHISTLKHVIYFMVDILLDIGPPGEH